jgi:hypothetical protein
MSFLDYLLKLFKVKHEKSQISPNLGFLPGYVEDSRREAIASPEICLSFYGLMRAISAHKPTVRKLQMNPAGLPKPALISVTFSNIRTP